MKRIIALALSLIMLVSSASMASTEKKISDNNTWVVDGYIYQLENGKGDSFTIEVTKDKQLLETISGTYGGNELEQTVYPIPESKDSYSKSTISTYKVSDILEKTASTVESYEPTSTTKASIPSDYNYRGTIDYNAFTAYGHTFDRELHFYSYLYHYEYDQYSFTTYVGQTASVLFAAIVAAIGTITLGLAGAIVAGVGIQIIGGKVEDAFDVTVYSDIYTYRCALKNPDSGGVRYDEGTVASGSALNHDTGRDTDYYETSGTYPALFDTNNSNFAYNSYCDFWSVTTSYPYPGVDRWR